MVVGDGRHGAQEATPLVHDGIMYSPARGRHSSLDGATGDLIWEYRPEVDGLRPRSAAPLAVAAANRPTSRACLSGPRLPRPPEAATRNEGSRNLAIFGDRIFGTTGDAHVIALEARTGR
jgi:glucose dehydrogenase